MWGRRRAGPGLRGLEGRAALVSEPSGQSQGPALRARLLEAYRTGHLRKAERSGQLARTQPGREGSFSWPGQLQWTWVKGTRALGGPGEGLGLRGGRLLLVSLFWA